MGSVTTPSLIKAVAADERSRDLQAVARWFAPELAHACVAEGLDPTVIRELGNTLSQAGGGLPHLVRIWPEQRARIQVLCNQAARALPTRVGQRLQQPSPPSSPAQPLPPQISWKVLHGYLKQQARGNAELEALLPESHGALRKQAARGKAPWSALKETRTLAAARQALDALRDG
jgi:hypothetical protein